MVNVEYNNDALRSLIHEGGSQVYKELSRRKSFVVALQAFVSLLRVLRNTKELLLYKQYNYRHSGDKSRVLINGCRTRRDLLFSEKEEGGSVVIYDLVA